MPTIISRRGIPGWKTDRGRIYITYGPPDEKESHPSGNAASTVPFEQWLYHLIQGVGTNVVIEFVDPNKTGEYRMTTDPAMTPALTRPPGAVAIDECRYPKGGRYGANHVHEGCGIALGPTHWLWRPQCNRVRTRDAQ